VLVKLSILGHCVAEYPSNITLRVGSSFKDYGGRIVEIADLITHPKFDKIKLMNDFALMVFKEPIDFDENVQPIELPYDYEGLADGTRCRVTGWGKMENDVRPQELRTVDVFTVNFVSFG
jgi:trypsin